MTADSDVPPLHVRVMGVTVAIESPDETTRARLARQWSRALVPTGDGPAARTVHAREVQPALADAHDYSLTTEVTLAALLATAGERFNLHAGGLADADGRVLALVGPSGCRTPATSVPWRRLPGRRPARTGSTRSRSTTTCWCCATVVPSDWRT